MSGDVTLDQLQPSLHFSVTHSKPVFMQKPACILARATALSTFFTIIEMLPLKT